METGLIEDILHKVSKIPRSKNVHSCKFRARHKYQSPSKIESHVTYLLVEVYSDWLYTEKENASLHVSHCYWNGIPWGRDEWKLAQLINGRVRFNKEPLAEFRSTYYYQDMDSLLQHILKIVSFTEKACCNALQNAIRPNGMVRLENNDSEWNLVRPYLAENTPPLKFCPWCATELPKMYHDEETDNEDNL